MNGQTYLDRQKLSAKLVWIAVAFLVIAIAGIGVTLFVSWKLEGGAAVINDLGSERMRTYRIAFLLSESIRDPSLEKAADLKAEITRLEEILNTLRRGDPARPLVLPRDPLIVAEVDGIRDQWLGGIRPAIEGVMRERDAKVRNAQMQTLRGDVEVFVKRVDAAVRAIERNNAGSTEVLRYMQFGLMAMALAGTVALIYLMFLLVVRPVERLSDGMRRMGTGDFGVRLPVETKDEFGELAEGFNRMAVQLQDVYQTLEERVASKTRSLEIQNRELTTLYEVASLLSEPADTETLCRQFLSRLIGVLGAAAGAVRLVDATSGDIQLYLHEGLETSFAQEEQCVRLGECLCGDAVRREASAVESFTEDLPAEAAYRCEKAGYRTVGIFGIRFRGRVIGLYNLYFRAPHAISSSERRMLEAVGRHLGVAIENQRLIARVKEMAASEERTFLAQELHDSIAQSLAFLNLEAQMLEDAHRRSATDDAKHILAEMREGIRQSYEDVRELLVHFRTRVRQEDIALTIRHMLDRFSSQTGVKASFDESGSSVPLPPDSQLQVVHILQEALSNVRKHAGAASVQIAMERGRVYRFTVRDDGHGFDAAARAAGERHVGLRIMSERAERIGGSVNIESAPGQGTKVTLMLPVIREEVAA